MDVLYHAAVGFAISEAAGRSGNPVIIAAAIAPDIAGTLPFWFAAARDAYRRNGSILSRETVRTLMGNTFIGSFDKTAYRLFHSFTSVVITGAIGIFAFPDIWLPVTASYLSHILVDIPTHEGDFATRTLYPFSDAHISRYNWASHPSVFILFWALLVGYFFITRLGY